MFAYCGNDPILKVDYIGRWWIVLIIGLAAVGSVWADHINSNARYNKQRYGSVNGYIYDQSSDLVAGLNYGLRDTESNGCGWIATYNAMLMLGENVEAYKVAHELEYYASRFYGLAGTTRSGIAFYFESKGYNVIMTSDVSKFDELAKNSDACIVFYCHDGKITQHFVAVKWDGTQFLAYNGLGNKKMNPIK